jgi:hypothetical protein
VALPAEVLKSSRGLLAGPRSPRRAGEGSPSTAPRRSRTTERAEDGAGERRPHPEVTRTSGKRRSWSQVVAVASGLAANVVAI